MAKKHLIRRRSLVSWRCTCGERWNNNMLKGKTDEDLADENAAEFSKHQEANN